jgi:NAD(P)-dependent dehydrogenase (short-subunit alcohol dehydrogenase family)
MESLSGRVVCITSPSGIGTLLARRFAEDGAQIVISAPDVAELERMHGDLAKQGVDVLAYPCDATNGESVQELVDMAVLWCGRLDVLVMNAPSDEGVQKTVLHILEPPFRQT